MRTYGSVSDFASDIEAFIAEASRRGADLVIFPEYINVFLALVEEIDTFVEEAEDPTGPSGLIKPEGLNRQEGFEEAKEKFFGRIAGGESGGEVSSGGASGGEVQAKNSRAKMLHRFFRERSEFVRRQMDRIWGRAAREYSMWIVAGTYFAAAGIAEISEVDGNSEPAEISEVDGNSEVGEKSEGKIKKERDHKEEPEDRELGKTPKKKALYNRALVYGPKGEVVYSQDKVYLTPFERDQLLLSSGEKNDARTFETVRGWECVLTICRDTFFEEWNRRFSGAELWIDLKANGEQFDKETEKLFARALPERIRQSEVPYGATACLNGRFLDLIWEGPSSIMAWKGNSIRYLRKASAPDEEVMLTVKLEPVNLRTEPSLPGNSDNGDVVPR